MRSYLLVGLIGAVLFNVDASAEDDVVEFPGELYCTVQCGDETICVPCSEASAACGDEVTEPAKEPVEEPVEEPVRKPVEEPVPVEVEMMCVVSCNGAIFCVPCSEAATACRGAIDDEAIDSIDPLL